MQIYDSTDPDGLPEELKGKVNGNQRGKFVVTRVFVYSDEKQEYVERLPAKVVVRLIAI